MDKTDDRDVTTVYRAFRRTVSLHSDRPALRFKRNRAEARITYGQMAEQVAALRRAMHAMGVARGDRVAILAYNRPEWIIADLAIQGLGAIDVPIYHTLPASQVGHYLKDSGARFVFTEDERQSEKVRSLGDAASIKICQFSGPVSGDISSFDTILENAGSDTDLDSRLDAEEGTVSPDAVATFIYTSGTTGSPKGAMLSHRALLHTGRAAQEIVTVDERDVFLSFLPLCHVVERVGGYYLPLQIGAEIVISQGPIALAAELAEADATIFICVPRVFDLMRERALEAIAQLPPLRRRIANLALTIGRRRASANEAGGGPGMALSCAYALAGRLVLRTVRRRLTGRCMRFLVSGGAPLHRDTGYFMASIGTTILEGYGLTEFPVISLNRPNDNRIGTVGTALPGVEIRISENGEIQARGPSLMMGYHNRPEDTAAIIEDGWLKSGDVGSLDADGRLRITDRIKDIIVLGSGKNVAPQPIEALLRRSPFISEAVLFGDGSVGLVGLIVPDFDRLKAHLRSRGHPDCAGNEELVGQPAAVKVIKDEIAAASAELADYERVKDIRLLPRPFTIETGELTPTMKTRRRIIAERYAAQLNAMTRR